MPDQGSLLEEAVQAGLFDEDDTDAPQLTTTEPGDTAPEQTHPPIIEPDLPTMDAPEGIVPPSERIVVDDTTREMLGQTTLQPPEADGNRWTGADALRPYLVRIEDLKPTPGNPNKGKAHVILLRESLRQFGQVRAILTDAAEGGLMIRAGHHLTLAAEDLGWTHIAAIPAEFDDEGKAIAYLMADNQLAARGNEDANALEQYTLLNDLDPAMRQVAGYREDDLEDLAHKGGAVQTITEVEAWGGAASESAAEAAARAEALSQYEPHKEVQLYLNEQEHATFSEHIRLLQSAWGTKGVLDTIMQALKEGYEREAAPIDVGSPHAEPYDTPADPEPTVLVGLPAPEDFETAESPIEAVQPDTPEEGFPL